MRTSAIGGKDKSSDGLTPFRELMAMLQHEAGGSLSVIIANADRLRERGAALGESPAGLEEWEASTQEIQQQARKLALLVDNLYLIATDGLGNLDLEPLLLQRVLPRLVRAANYEYQNRQVIFAIPEELEPVMANVPLLEVVVENIISNACKYSSACKPLIIRGWQDEGGVVASVRDFGLGVGPDELDAIFELFYRSPTSSKQAKGSGVGLAVCRKILGLMGGSISARLPEGPGLEVMMSLPAAVE